MDIDPWANQIKSYSVRVVFYAFRYTDFGKSTQTILSRSVFTQFLHRENADKTLMIEHTDVKILWVHGTRL